MFLLIRNHANKNLTKNRLEKKACNQPKKYNYVKKRLSLPYNIINGKMDSILLLLDLCNILPTLTKQKFLFVQYKLSLSIFHYVFVII